MICCNINIICGQEMEEFLPTVLTPNAAAFAKYGDVPVSEYTGIPDITIPVYTLKDGNIELPIRLSYHASGIQVDQEASWIGLGWSLNLGGAITQNIKGIDDLKVPFLWTTNTDAESSVMNFGKNDFLAYHFTNVIKQKDVDMTTQESLVAERIISGYYQPDIFNYSFASRSGHFFVDYSDNTVHVSKPDGNLRIFRPNEKYDNLIGNEDEGWTIIDEAGIKYFFDKIEEVIQPGGIAAFGSAISRTYYLTKILYQNGDSVVFQYVKKNVTITPVFKHNATYTTGFSSLILPGLTEKNTFYSYQPVYLYKVTTPNFEISLTTSSDRKDIPGEEKLEKIIIKSRVDSLKTKEFIFNYENYFEGANKAEPRFTYNSIFSDEQLEKRLKLTSFGEKGEVPYYFSYNDLPLPMKTSNSRDYWGFYNGKSNNDLIPDIVKYSRFNNYGIYATNVSGSANRGVDADYMKAGVLTEIKYPTGGITTFDFEPHSFSNYYYEKAQIEQLNLRVESNSRDGIYYGGDLISSKNFVLEQDAYINLKIYIEGCYNAECTLDGDYRDCYTDVQMYLHIKDAYLRLYKDGSIFKTWKIPVPTEEVQYPRVLNTTFNTMLEPGNYKIETFVNWGDCKSIGDLTITNKDNWSIGSGLRIKRIASYNNSIDIANVDPLLERNYIYEDETQTFGKLLVPLKFITSVPYLHCSNPYISSGVSFYTCPIYDGNCLTMHSNSTIGNAQTEGNIVGYSKVIVTESRDNIKTRIESNYINIAADLSPDDGEFSLPAIHYSSNGNILSRDYFDETDRLVRKDEFCYSLIEDYMYYGVDCKNRYYGPEGSILNSITNEAVIASKLYSFMFYTLKTERYLIDSKKTIEYFEGGKEIYNTEDYEYNNKYQLSIITKTNSKREVIQTIYKYPFDISNSINNELIIRNIITPLIEIETSVKGNKVSGQQTQYAYLEGNTLNYSGEIPEGALIVPGIVKIWETTGSFLNDVIYDKYSPQGNLLQYHKRNDINVSFVWAYNGQYPVIKAENASSSILNSVVGMIMGTILYMTDIDDLLQNNGEAEWVTFNYELRKHADLAGALITTYTYDPLVGMTSETDPNGKTTYYEYDDFGRLEFIKDHKGNVLKKYDYHYAETNP